MHLNEIGWDDDWASAFEPHAAAGLVPARVAIRHHGPYVLWCEDGRLGGITPGRMAEDELPAVGDWVAGRRLPGERKLVIEAVLPRRTAFSRKEAWRRTAEQVVAANVDTVFLVTALEHDLNLRRLERYLTMAWESGAAPVILLTKSDLCPDAETARLAVESIAIGVPVHVLSSVTGDGLAGLEPYLAPGRTLALLGSSGVGKSTLINRLAGEELLATRDIRADGRGRHTTTHRELVLLPGGAMLLDTPGMRELQLWEAPDGLAATFADVEELAAACRFSDCAHATEPGCRILEALAEGTLDADRWDSYCRLQRELQALEIRQDSRLGAEARKERRRAARGRRRVVY